MSVRKVLTGLLAALLLSACMLPQKQNYETSLFDTGRVHTVEVNIDPEDWQDLLAHPEKKTKYEADLIIDGEEISQVSFSTKGNSSLAFAANNRYSFKINFGKYVKGQTWQGLDKLNLQNCFSDATYMKDYLSYWLFRETDVPAPLASYVFLKVNGEDYGLYLAVEEMENSFLARTLQGKGTLYKPEQGELELDPDAAADIEGGGSVIIAGAHGADFVYIDDQPASYPDIFDNAVTDSDSETEARVIAALKGLQENRDPEEILDTQLLIRYFAVHNFLLNYDSYTGLMLHNYYLYERDGKLGLLPWDYNAALGCFPIDGIIAHTNPADIVINQGIDTPLIGAKEEERPMWAWITRDEEYLASYHAVMAQLIREQIDAEKLIRELDRVQAMIRPYIERDPTAFFTPQEAEQAWQAQREVILRRAESVRRQLSGTLASRTERQNPADRVDTSDIDLAVLKTGQKQ